MKNHFLLFIFFIMTFFNFVSAQQTTWVKYLSYDIGSVSHNRYDSLWVGPYEFAPTQDGKIYLLDFDNMNSDQSLFCIDSLGQSSQSFIAGQYGSLHTTRAFNLKSAPNNKCIYIEHNDDWGGPGQSQIYTLFLVSTSGRTLVHSWTMTQGVGDIMDMAIPNYHNSYYCRVNNVWIDFINGDTVNSIANCNYIFSNDDFLFQDMNFYRKDMAGNIQWTFPSLLYHFLVGSDNIFYAINFNGDSLRKVDANSGSILWTRPWLLNGYANYSFQNSTNGIVAINGRKVSVIDSSGHLIHTDTISFPHAMQNVIASLSDGSIIVGGQFISALHSNYSLGEFGYASMLIKMNSFAAGNIDSMSDYYYCLDADHDGDDEFDDDAVVIVAAFGNSNFQAHVNYFNPGGISFSSDWTSSFQSGLNYKYSDVNFDGTIDTNDLSTSCCGMNNLLLHTDTSGEYIKFTSDNYAPSFGDTFNLYVTLGDLTNPIDSIYGISLGIYSNQNGISFFDWQVKNNVIGDTASNLYFLAIPFGSSAVVCRTDHVNTSFVADTILTVKATYLAILPNPITLNLIPHLLSKGGYTIPANVDSSVITLFSILNVNDIRDKNEITVYPNPADDWINIFSSRSKIESVIVYDIMGNIIEKTTPHSMQHILNTKKYNEGVYILSVHYDGKEYLDKFIIQHK